MATEYTVISESPDGVRRNTTLMAEDAAHAKQIVERMNHDIAVQEVGGPLVADPEQTPAQQQKAEQAHADKVAKIQYKITKAEKA